MVCFHSGENVPDHEAMNCGDCHFMADETNNKHLRHRIREFPETENCSDPSWPLS